MSPKYSKLKLGLSPEFLSPIFQEKNPLVFKRIHPKIQPVFFTVRKYDPDFQLWSLPTFRSLEENGVAKTPGKGQLEEQGETQSASSHPISLHIF